MITAKEVKEANDRGECIRTWGTTYGCACDKCFEEIKKRLDDLMNNLFKVDNLHQG